MDIKQITASLRAERDKTVVFEFFEEKRRQREIAERHSISVSYVKQIVKRAKESKNG